MNHGNVEGREESLWRLSFTEEGFELRTGGLITAFKRPGESQLDKYLLCKQEGLHSKPELI